MSARRWIVVADDTAVGALVEVGRALGGELVAVAVGERRLADAVARVVDRVDWFEPAPGTPAEALAGAVAERLAEAGAEVVLGGTGPGSRVVLGAVAARLGAPVLAGVRDVVEIDGAVQVTRMVSGGIAIERDRVRGPVALVLDGGRRIDEDSRREPAPVRAVLAQPGPVVCDGTGTAVAEQHDLASAARVVGVGRGVRDRGDLAVVGELARALGAEVACSRPVAEDLGWMPKDCYLGISGRRIAPRLYLALGISGQVQHMIGVRDAGTIVAVNLDPAAEVMTAADIAVVADVHALLPALVRELGRTR